jgi:hypothetical protein
MDLRRIKMRSSESTIFGNFCGKDLYGGYSEIILNEADASKHVRLDSSS